MKKKNKKVIIITSPRKEKVKETSPFDLIKKKQFEMIRTNKELLDNEESYYSRINNGILFRQDMEMGG